MSECVGVKAEEDSDGKFEQDPVAVTSRSIKSEHEVGFQCPLLSHFNRYLGLHSSLPVAFYVGQYVQMKIAVPWYMHVGISFHGIQRGLYFVADCLWYTCLILC
jgi:hypothetical protein